jgi:hypothetical protein
MKFNITRQFEVALQAEPCFDFLEREININKGGDFNTPILLVFGRYRFYRKKNNKFALIPPRFQRGIAIYGLIEQYAGKSVLYYKMFPPTWFYIPFSICMSIVFFYTNPSLEWFFLPLLAGLAGLLSSCAARKLMGELEKVLATKSEP